MRAARPCTRAWHSTAPILRRQTDILVEWHVPRGPFPGRYNETGGWHHLFNATEYGLPHGDAFVTRDALIWMLHSPVCVVVGWVRELSE